jgi:hypothetical protein
MLIQSHMTHLMHPWQKCRHSYASSHPHLHFPIESNVVEDGAALGDEAAALHKPSLLAAPPHKLLDMPYRVHV